MHGPGPPPTCPSCGYDRSGDRARRCPECGSKLPPRIRNYAEVGSGLLGLITVTAGVWLAAYLLLTARTYHEGVWFDMEADSGESLSPWPPEH